MNFGKISTVFIVMLLSNLLYAEEEVSKIRLDSSQIVFINQGIFAYLGGDYIPVESISTDANGLYAVKRNPYAPWQCKRPTCNYINNYWEESCQNQLPNGKLCGWPRPQ